MSLGRKTVQGVFWTYISFGSSKLLSFLSMVVLARLLVPEQFGQVAIAMLAIAYLDAVGDLGIAAALIYQRDNVDRASQVAFWISVAMGVLLWGMLTLTAPWIGRYFDQPAVTPMLRVLALTFPLQALGNVHKALLSKELEFRRKFLPEFVGYFSRGFGSIALALLGLGAWSLVWGQVLGVATMTAALWFVQPWRPSMVWSNEIARRMLSYGTQIIGIEVLSVVWATADYVIIARWLSDADLGLYQQSFRVSDLLIISLCFAAGRVLFPSFAKVNDNLERLQSSFLVALRYIALLALPMSIGLFVVAPLFVAAVFGENWLPMIPVLQWLALRAGIHAISFNTGHVLKATGRPDIVTKQMLVKLGVLVPVVLLTVRYGIVAVALGQVGVAIFSALVEFGTIIVVLGVPVKRIWQQIQSPLLASFGMGGMVWFVMLYFPEGLPSLALAGSVITGFAAYAALLLLFERQFVIDSVRSGVRLLRPHSPTTVK